MHRTVRLATRLTLVALLAAGTARAGLVVEEPEMSAGGEAAFKGTLVPRPVEDNSPAPAPAPFAPGLIVSWDAIDFSTNATQTGFFQIPPDPHGAVGTGHLVNIVNSSIQWFTRAGVLQNTQRLGRNSAGSIVGSFFEPLNPANTLFDPKVLYDQFSDRFVVVVLEQVGNPNTSRILLAASDDGDPNGTWYYQAINGLQVINGLNTWADYPGFALDEEAVYVCVNQFSFAGSFQGNRLYIVNKANLYANAPTAAGVYDPSALATGPDGPYFSSTMQPAHVFGATPAGTGTWLTMYSGLTDGTNEALQVIRIDNPLGAITFNGNFVPVGNIDTASGTLPRSPQLGTTFRIDTGDRRSLHSVWRNGHLYTVFQVNPPAPSTDNGECTAHWTKVSTAGGPAMVDQGDISGDDTAADAATSYPSIAVNSRGDIAIGFALGSSTFYQKAAYTGRTATDPAGTVQATGIMVAGTDYYIRTFGCPTTSRNRWGDYTGTVVDPMDDCAFWHFNEYPVTRGQATGTTTGCAVTSEDGRYRTRWGSWTFSCPPVPVALASFTAARNGDAAVVSWEVKSAFDHAGFNLYRGDESDRVKLNADLLSGRVRYEFRDAAAPAGGARYWLQEISRSGASSWLGPVVLAPASSRVPVTALAAGQPNPFHGATTIAYSVGVRGPVRVSVFDISGHKVATLLDNVQEAGDHSVSWDGRTSSGEAASAGFYIVRLETGGKALTQKLILSR